VQIFLHMVFLLSTKCYSWYAISYDWLAHYRSLVKGAYLIMHNHGVCLQHGISMRLPRENDVFTMEAFKSLNLSYWELRSCYHCHMFLWWLFVSDITTGDSLLISDNAWIGQVFHNYRAKYWPEYGKPTKAQWHIWQCCIWSTLLGRGWHLRQPLGKWLHRDDKWRCTHFETVYTLIRNIVEIPFTHHLKGMGLIGITLFAQCQLHIDSAIPYHLTLFLRY
jgi:hypothetical protein